MADHTHITNTDSGTGSSNGALAFIVGALVVAVGIVAWIMFADDDDLTVGTDSVNVTIDGGQTAAENAADAVEDAASSAASAVENAAEETEEALTGN